MQGNQQESYTGKGGESENQSFETHLCLQFQHDQHQFDIPDWNIEFPMTQQTNSSILFCQHNSQLTSSLQSEAESLVSSSEEDINYSSTQKSFEHSPQEHINVLVDDGVPYKRSLGISFQRIHKCTKLKKQSSPCGVANVASSSSVPKRRIRWTNHLHDSFTMVVNHLGGPFKAKPKAILKMMGSDVLTISHVKSHLQKFRSTLHMHKALKERSDEGHRTEGITELQLNIQMQIEESLQSQLEVQKSIQRQLEMHRSMQLLIEQQRKQLNLMLKSQKAKNYVGEKP